MKRFRSLAVLAVTILLLYLVLRKVGTDELLNTLRQANLSWVLLSFMLIPVINLVNVIKWNILLHAQGADVPLLYLFKLYLIGYFFNHFLPSNVGGDVMRIYELGSRTKDPAGAAASVFVERLTGFIVLFVIAIIAILIQPTMGDDPWLILAAAAVIVMFAGVLWLILDLRILNFIERTFRFGPAQKYTVKFRKFHNSLKTYRQHRRALALAFLWSAVFYVISIINTYIAAMAFHADVPFWGIVLVTPLISVVSVLPLTFNGAGIQEWAYVLLFGWLGLPGSVGLSTILLIRAKVLLIASVGGLLYAGSKLQTAAAAHT